MYNIAPHTLVFPLIQCPRPQKLSRYNRLNYILYTYVLKLHFFFRTLYHIIQYDTLCGWIHENTIFNKKIKICIICKCHKNILNS